MCVLPSIKICILKVMASITCRWCLLPVIPALWEAQIGDFDQHKGLGPISTVETEQNKTK